MADIGTHTDKTCRKCGEAKPATTEFYYRKQNRLSSRCIVCMVEYNRAYREKNGKKLLAQKSAIRLSDLARHREITRRNVAECRARKPDYYRAYGRDRHHRNQKDPKYRITAAIRTSVRVSLRGVKSARTEALLGYSSGFRMMLTRLTTPRTGIDSMTDHSDMIERLRVAIDLGGRTGSRGKRPENIYNVADEALPAPKRRGGSDLPNLRQLHRSA